MSILKYLWSVSICPYEAYFQINVFQKFKPIFNYKVSLDLFLYPKYCRLHFAVEFFGFPLITILVKRISNIIKQYQTWIEFLKKKLN